MPSHSSTLHPLNVDPFVHLEGKSLDETMQPYSSDQVDSIPILRNNQPSYHRFPPPSQYHMYSSCLIYDPSQEGDSSSSPVGHDPLDQLYIDLVIAPPSDIIKYEYLGQG